MWCVNNDISGHPWFRCKEYSTSEDKLTRPENKLTHARNLYLCLKCLAKDHCRSDCKFKLKPCFHCGADHYYQLCTKDKQVEKIKNSNVSTTSNKSGAGSIGG